MCVMHLPVRAFRRMICAYDGVHARVRMRALVHLHQEVALGVLEERDAREPISVDLPGDAPLQRGRHAADDPPSLLRQLQLSRLTKVLAQAHAQVLGQRIELAEAVQVVHGVAKARHV
eukprot:5548392-Pleurochrysis_carterae.AAC.1